MKRDDNLRNHYYKYLRKSDKANVRSINSIWGFSFIIAGGGLGILFCAFLLENGFKSVILSVIGIASLLLIIIGLIVLINYE